MTDSSSSELSAFSRLRMLGRAVDKANRHPQSTHAHSHKDPSRPHPRALFISLAALGVLVAFGVAFWLLAWPKASFKPSSVALADLQLGGAGGHLVHAYASYSDHEVTLLDHSGSLLPTCPLPVDTEVHVAAEVQRPSWISWLAGTTQELSEQVRTPYAHLVNPVVLARPGQAVVAKFNVAVREVSVATPRSDPTIKLAEPATAIKVLPSLSKGQAGTVSISAVPDTWEALPKPAHLVYFATLHKATTMAILSPSVATAAQGVSSPLELTLSKPVAKVFGKKLPSFVPVVKGALVPKGTWSDPTPYTLEFTPSGPQFWPGEQIRMELPDPVSFSAGGAGSGAGSTTTSVVIQGAPGSTLRLQQMLATLGYLPLSWSASPSVVEPSTLSGQASLIEAPLPGSFAWKWSFPTELTSLWAPGQYSVVTKGAVMAFEQVDGLDPDGLANPLLWPSLIQAVLAHKMDPHPYTWIQVSMALPERLWLWSNGKVVLTSLANTGIPQSPTAPGTYPIYERFAFNYMSGYNPNGTYYHDPVHWINYFNGGDAVHGFVRASYGFPQSLGCVELPVPVAAQVFPQVHMGTLVSVY